MFACYGNVTAERRPADSKFTSPPVNGCFERFAKRLRGGKGKVGLVRSPRRDRELLLGVPIVPGRHLVRLRPTPTRGPGVRIIHYLLGDHRDLHSVLTDPRPWPAVSGFQRELAVGVRSAGRSGARSVHGALGDW